jgi:hypothetical protein
MNEWAQAALSLLCRETQYPRERAWAIFHFTPTARRDWYALEKIVLSCNDGAYVSLWWLLAQTHDPNNWVMKQQDHDVVRVPCYHARREVYTAVGK